MLPDANLKDDMHRYKIYCIHLSIPIATMVVMKVMTYTDWIYIRCVPKKCLLGLLITQIPQPAWLVDTASYIALGVRWQRDGYHIPCVGFKLHGAFTHLQVPQATTSTYEPRHISDSRHILFRVFKANYLWHIWK